MIDRRRRLPAVLMLAGFLLAPGSQAEAQNAVLNAGFETPNSTLSPANYVVSYSWAAAHMGGAWSSAAHWRVFNNTPATTTTELVASTDPLAECGKYMIHVTTTGAQNGLFQMIEQSAPVWADLDVYVISGRVGFYLYRNHGMLRVAAANSTGLNRWEHLRLSQVAEAQDEIVVYADDGPAEFYVDNSWVSTQGFRPAAVPEPGVPSAALALGGVLAGGFLAGRRRMAIVRSRG